MSPTYNSQNRRGAPPPPSDPPALWADVTLMILMAVVTWILYTLV